MQMIAMCLADGIDDNQNISRRSIYRTIFKSLSYGATQRLLNKASKKRKRMEEEDLSEFLAVDHEKRRSKYDDADILSLRKWMCNNRYTRESPNTKDTIDERDMYGKVFIFKLILLRYLVKTHLHCYR